MLFYSFHASTGLFVYVWMCRSPVCVCVCVPLDGINNNKAKLRESLITISRFHLTALRAHNGEQHSSYCTKGERDVWWLFTWLGKCELHALLRVTIYSVFAIKLYAGFISLVLCACLGLPFVCKAPHMLRMPLSLLPFCTPHSHPHRNSFKPPSSSHTIIRCDNRKF